MQDLRLVGVHDDGEHVVLVGTDGSRYRLRVDEALRAAVRRDRARLGQLQIQMEAQMRPRDIQARIRAGETAEEVAAAGGLTLEHVRRYEGPVLAERAHVSGLARRTPYGRSPVAGTLDEVVVARLSARAVDPEGARWDAWRSEDDGWIVQCEFVAGGRGRVARWGFDPAARVLSAHDDEARWLSEEEPAEPGPLPGRRLVSVAGEGVRSASERVYDVEADGGVRANQQSPTDDILQALESARGRRPGQQDPSPAPAEPVDPPAPRTDALTADPPPAHPAESSPEDVVDRTVLPAPAAGEAAGEATDEAADEATDQSTGEAGDDPGTDSPLDEDDERGTGPDGAADAGAQASPEVAEDPAEPNDPAEPVDPPAPAGEAPPAAQDPQPDPPATSRRRNRSARRGSAAAKRPSVPSWDDIMFGTKKD
ncbi:septation protein SepH [Kineococcus sp. LSe6-4]|uniref:Septation protein SepH n=1 Tax=Kineococcus halophytocola TaxID=3234027 RepID=A0ABV4GZV2_9ACTN